MALTELCVATVSPQWQSYSYVCRAFNVRGVDQFVVQQPCQGRAKHRPLGAQHKHAASLLLCHNPASRMNVINHREPHLGGEGPEVLFSAQIIQENIWQHSQLQHGCHCFHHSAAAVGWLLLLLLFPWCSLLLAQVLLPQLPPSWLGPDHPFRHYWQQTVVYPLILCSEGCSKLTQADLTLKVTIGQQQHHYIGAFNALLSKQKPLLLQYWQDGTLHDIVLRRAVALQPNCRQVLDQALCQLSAV